MTENDEDMAKESLDEAQETAGFHEPPQRLALGGHFNHMLMWSVMRREGDAESQPEGHLLDAMTKHYTSFDGFKAAFLKTVMSRAMPGWVWLGVLKSGDLVITQTNNEDNPMMGGIAEPVCIPVMGIDLWEHAYFTVYKGDKAAYCEEFMGRINWAKVSASFKSCNLSNYVAALI
jgi:Fe-Mn family superoxide dismutase